MPAGDFAAPGKRKLPMPDERHVRLAWSQVDRVGGLTDAERTEAKRRIIARAKGLGMDVTDWMAASGDAGLYVRRNLTDDSAAALTAWAEGQGITNLTPPHEMHATVVYSTTGVPIHPEPGEITASPDGRSVAPLGDKGAIVLHFVSPELEGRWQMARDAGATWEFNGYRPHVTISYDADGIDPDQIEPFNGDLVFGPEIHEPLNTSWAEGGGLRMAASGVRLEGESLEAMAVTMPTVFGHPNRMPFSGILTRLDKPSDKAVGGAGGKRVIFTTTAAQRALPSLMGMAVGLNDTLDGHNVRNKIGIITAASIEGDAVHVDGFIYARDFPKEASRIQTEKGQLGFSWELADIFVESLDADPLVITDACFTGAAILRKDKAAYGSTSLAASAEEQDMTKEEMQALLAEAITPLGDSVKALAAAQETQGETIAKLSASAEASAAETAEAVDKAAQALKDAELATAKAKITELEAAAANKTSEPERKTLSPQISALLARADLAMPGEGEKLSLGKVDAALSKSGLSPVKRMEIKNELQRSGALG